MSATTPGTDALLACKTDADLSAWVDGSFGDRAVADVRYAVMGLRDRAETAEKRERSLGRSFTDAQESNRRFIASLKAELAEARDEIATLRAARTE